MGQDMGDSVIYSTTERIGQLTISVTDSNVDKRRKVGAF